MEVAYAAWLAGFIDGEGCVSARRNGRHISAIVQIIQKDRAILDEIAERLGFGRVHRYTSGVHVLQVTARGDLLALVALIQPYARVKREQVALVGQLAALVGQPITPEVDEERERLGRVLRIKPGAY